MAHQLIRLSTITLFIATGIYTIISKVLFDKIYETSTLIVDEEFHLPLGKAYCHHDFNKWDPKVTTLPGLYLLSAFLLSNFGLCSTYWLRFVSFLSSTVNFVLFYMVYKLYNKEVAWKNVIATINLSILPPLYFFSHLYYTDVASIMTTMLLLLSAKKKYHNLSSLFGAMAIMMRQTNVIWIGMLLGDYILKGLYFSTIKHPKKVGVPLKGFQHLLRNIFIEPVAVLNKLNIQFLLGCSAYMSVIVSFMLFVYLNGSIVVGDKTAHEATLHITQIFYFATFTLLLGWPHFLSCIIPFYYFVKKNKALTLGMVLLSLIVVHFNTLIHPYMLADNRHYTFYVWNRFYGRYNLFRYGIIPVYIFALHGIVFKIWDNKNVTFPLMFIVGTVLVLIMQKLIEVRYYLFPFILFRIQIKKTSSVVLFLETLTYLVVNVFTLYTFFNKSIIWDTYDYPQRLIW